MSPTAPVSGCRLSATGAQLAPVASGVDTALGRLLAIVYTAMAEGTWVRLKVCRVQTNLSNTALTPFGRGGLACLHV